MVVGIGCAPSLRQTVNSIGSGGDSKVNFQELIMRLEHFWSQQGCVIQHSYDMEVGAGTMNPATTLRVIGPEHGVWPMWRASGTSTDGRYGKGQFVCCAIAINIR